ncbi:hypothetical protein G4B88_020709 [Cannabis sativa]|uniref:Uncharacterized protein n=1 Tax=Cannabis sativa TaxID=3483 RepID=A0A7J6HLF7_CANSA|nr:hypothetical protein G4B88_020709 [Cannabis sativa]
MSMGEASRILAAVERGRVRYSGPTHEELAPTSVLEGRERDVGVKSRLATGQGGKVAAGVSSSLKGTQAGVAQMVGNDLGKVVPRCESDEINEPLGDVVANQGEGGECSLMHELPDCDMVEVSFTQALQQTFEPLINAQKAKTWKRLNSSRGRGSKGMSKSSSIPISPKLSHVLVANAKNKASPKVGGGGKRKMNVDVQYESVKKGRLEAQSDGVPENVSILLAKPAQEP